METDDPIKQACLEAEPTEKRVTKDIFCCGGCDHAFERGAAVQAIDDGQGNAEYLNGPGCPECGTLLSDPQTVVKVVEFTRTA